MDRGRAKERGVRVATTHGSTALSTSVDNGVRLASAHGHAVRCCFASRVLLDRWGPGGSAATSTTSKFKESGPVIILGNDQGSPSRRTLPIRPRTREVPFDVQKHGSSILPAHPAELPRFRDHGYVARAWGNQDEGCRNKASDQEDLPAEQSPTQAQARVPCAHADARRTGDPEGSPGQGSRETVGLRSRPP